MLKLQAFMILKYESGGGEASPISEHGLEMRSSTHEALTETVGEESSLYWKIRRSQIAVLCF